MKKRTKKVGEFKDEKSVSEVGEFAYDAWSFKELRTELSKRNGLKTGMNRAAIVAALVAGNE